MPLILGGISGSFGLYATTHALNIADETISRCDEGDLDPERAAVLSSLYNCIEDEKSSKSRVVFVGTHEETTIPKKEGELDYSEYIRWRRNRPPPPPPSEGFKLRECARNIRDFAEFDPSNDIALLREERPKQENSDSIQDKFRHQLEQQDVCHGAIISVDTNGPFLGHDWNPTLDTVDFFLDECSKSGLLIALGNSQTKYPITDISLETGRPTLELYRILIGLYDRFHGHTGKGVIPFFASPWINSIDKTMQLGKLDLMNIYDQAFLTGVNLVNVVTSCGNGAYEAIGRMRFDYLPLIDSKLYSCGKTVHSSELHHSSRPNRSYVWNRGMANVTWEGINSTCFTDEGIASPWSASCRFPNDDPNFSIAQQWGAPEIQRDDTTNEDFIKLSSNGLIDGGKQWLPLSMKQSNLVPRSERDQIIEWYQCVENIMDDMTSEFVDDLSDSDI